MVWEDEDRGLGSSALTVVTGTVLSHSRYGNEEDIQTLYRELIPQNDKA